MPIPTKYLLPPNLGQKMGQQYLEYKEKVPKLL